MRSLTILIPVLLGTSAMASDAAIVKSVDGQWAGPGAIMMLTNTGGEISYDCGHGTIEGAIRPDSKGRFSARGRHEDYGPGPQRADAHSAMRRADYQGAIEGPHMTLHVRVAGQPDERVFHLEQGRRTKIMRCL